MNPFQMLFRILILILTIQIVFVNPLTTEDEEETVGIVSSDEEDEPEKLRYDDQLKKEQNMYHTAVTNLEKMLLQRGGVYRVPWKSPKEQVMIIFFLHNVNHISFNQTDQTMLVTGRICMMWHDPNYYWDPLKYDGVTHLSLHRWNVWSPNLEVFNGVDGLAGIWAFTKSGVKLFLDSANNRSIILSCPSFNFKVGCEIDASSFPHDSHVCRFPITDLRNNENIDLTNTFTEEIKTNFVYAITRKNDTKPNVADFYVEKITSRIVYFNDETNEYVSKRNKSTDMVVALNEVHFTRYAPYFFHTLVLPSIVFGLISAFAPLMPFLQASTLLLMNFVLLGVYMRDLIDELPIHFDSLPRIMIYWLFQLSISFLQLARIFLAERARIERKERVIWRTLNEWNQLPLNEKLLNFDLFFIFLSFLSIFILLW